MTVSKLLLPAAILVIAAGVVSAQPPPASVRAGAVARSFVIGQAYVSGNVYVAGFAEDEPRLWPGRIRLWPLRQATNLELTADFFRTVTQDSEEQLWFPQREVDADSIEADVFSTMDRAAVTDRNLARYRSTPMPKPLSFLGVEHGVELIDVETFVAGPLRPWTPRERAAVEAEKKTLKAPETCTTVPQYLDDARLLLTARIASWPVRIRLSHFATPGCAGHLTDVYVLDVIAGDDEPRRYEFRHYQGVL